MDRAPQSAIPAGFLRDGYVGPLPVFTGRETRRIYRRLLREPGMPPVAWEKGAAVSSRLLYELATYRPILDLVEMLLGPDVVLWGASLVRRAPGQVHPWHTDKETSRAGSRAVSVWIGLSHTSLASSLLLVPGSHRFGASLQAVAAEKGKAHRPPTDGEVLAWAQRFHAASVIEQREVRDGEALVLDGQLWHGSRNASRHARTALLLQYAAAEAPIRIPDPTRPWPIRFQEIPRPPCILVRGTASLGVNRILPGPARPDREREPMMSSWIRPLDLPLAPDPAGLRAQYPIFNGQTPQLRLLTCHSSVLSPGRCPHPPHVHPEEEILVMLAGEADLVISDEGAGGGERLHRLRPGSFAYYPAGQRHTIRNPGPGPATYLMFKWQGDEAGNRQALGTRICDYQDESLPAVVTGGKTTRHVRHDGTRYLRALHCHHSAVEPGGGYPAHIDAHDVAILVLEGTVETLGQRVGPHGVIFYAAGEPHGLRNPGSVPARYLVFEFHGASMTPIRSRAGALRRLARRSPLARQAWNRFRRLRDRLRH